MATVQWVNVSSGEIIEGDENLYQAPEGWLPVFHERRKERVKSSKIKLKR